MVTHSECEISQSCRTQFSSHGAFNLNRADMPHLPLHFHYIDNAFTVCLHSVIIIDIVHLGDKNKRKYPKHKAISDHVISIYRLYYIFSEAAIIQLSQTNKPMFNKRHKTRFSLTQQVIFMQSGLLKRE